MSGGADGGYVVISFKIRSSMLRRLERIAEEQGINRSEAIRRAVAEYVMSREEGSKPTYWRVRRVVLE